MKMILLILCSLLPMVLSWSQSDVSIVAQIRDESGAKIELGNALVLNPEDSSLIVGDVFSQGHLQIDSDFHSNILLNVTALGYEPHWNLIEIPADGGRVDLGEIELLEMMLDGVEVIGRKHLYDDRGKNLVVNIADGSMSHAGSVLDVVQGLPKVLVNRTGQISVIGKGTALIYLDGKQIASNSILGTMSSNTIDRIEIIENPGARFDAAGNAVINIISKRNRLSGTRIGLTQRLGRGKFFRSYSQANAMFKRKRFSLQGAYGLRPWQWGGRNSQTRRHEDLTLFSEIDNYFVQRNERLDHDYSLLARYSLAPDLNVDLQFSGAQINGEKFADNVRSVASGEVEGFDILGRVEGPYKQNTNTLGISLTRSLDTLGSNWQVNGQYSEFLFDRTEKNRQQILSDLGEQILDRRSMNRADIKIYTIQMDYRQILNPALTWEGGLKNANISNRSDVRFEGLQTNGEFATIPEFTNGFSYRENIFAAYSQIHWKPGNTITINPGLRVEWTQTIGNALLQEGPDSYETTYANVFPTLHVQKNMVNSTVSLDYSYRINRPTFQDLNPYVLFIDSLLSLQGNPDLKPEYSHALSLGINHMGWSFDLNYNFNRNKINQVFRSLDSDNSEAISFVKENLKHTELVSASISRPFNYKRYSGYGTVGVFYDDHQIDDTEQLLKNNRWGYYVMLNQSLSIPGGITLDGYLSYTSSRVDGVYIDNPISYVHVAISKKFGERFNATLWANDIFDRWKYTGVTNFNRMSATYLSEGDWHFIRLNLNWNFGALKDGKMQRRKISKDELNRISSGT